MIKRGKNVMSSHCIPVAGLKSKTYFNAVFEKNSKKNNSKY